MGLGTKIKEAMHGDKETTSHQSPTTSSHNKTPGSFPADDVPRTSTVPAGSAGEPRTEKMHGRNSPDYTHGSGKDSSLTGTGTTGSHGGLSGSERRHEGGLSQHGTSGMTGANTTGTHGHNKLTKDAPYDEYGSATSGTHGTHGTAGAPEGTHGTHNSRVANAADPRIDSDRDHRAAPGSYAAPGMSSPSHGTGMSGSHGADPTMAGANTGMTGSTHGTGTHDLRKGPAGMTGTHTGNHNGSPGMVTGATGSHDNRVNTGSGMTGSHHGTTGGMTGGSNNMMRDHKVDEYDAPTNSSGRGQAGLAGAAGGVAASELANRHHKEDMHAYNTPGAGASSTDRGLNTTDRWHNTAPHGTGADPTMMGGNNMNTTGGSHMMDGTPSRGVNDPSMTTGNNPSLMGTTHMDPTGTSGHGHHGSMGNNNTSMLDPHNETGRTTYGTDNSGVGGVGGHHSHHGHRSNSNGMATGPAPHMSGGGMPADEYAAGTPHHSSMASGNSQHMGTAGNVSPTNNASPHHNNGGAMSGMGAMANSLPGMGEGHHGPGHAGAKVLHRCDHCGNDNDISKYFSKEAAYRMS